MSTSIGHSLSSQVTFTSLHEDILSEIISHLDWKSLKSLALVNKEISACVIKETNRIKKNNLHSIIDVSVAKLNVRACREQVEELKSLKQSIRDFSTLKSIREQYLSMKKKIMSVLSRLDEEELKTLKGVFVRGFYASLLDTRNIFLSFFNSQQFSPISFDLETGEDFIALTDVADQVLREENHEDLFIEVAEILSKNNDYASTMKIARKIKNKDRQSLAFSRVFKHFYVNHDFLNAFKASKEISNLAMQSSSLHLIFYEVFKDDLLLGFLIAKKIPNDPERTDALQQIFFELFYGEDVHHAFYVAKQIADLEVQFDALYRLVVYFLNEKDFIRALKVTCHISEEKRRVDVLREINKKLIIDQERQSGENQGFKHYQFMRGLDPNILDPW